MEKLNKWVVYDLDNTKCLLKGTIEPMLVAMAVQYHLSIGFNMFCPCFFMYKLNHLNECLYTEYSLHVNSRSILYIVYFRCRFFSLKPRFDLRKNTTSYKVISGIVKSQ